MIYKTFLEKLRAVCLEKGLKLQLIGFAGNDKDFPIYKIVVPGTAKNKKTIFFSAGIHGNEPAGPWAVIEFLKKFSPKKYRGPRMVIVPVMNPFGFENNKRRNAVGIDINRHFRDSRLRGDNKLIYDNIKDENVFFFHSMHEDPDVKKFYAYGYEEKPEKIYRDVVKVGGGFFKINKSKKIYGDVSENGLVLNDKGGSLENRLVHDRIPFILCTETPGKEPFEKRTRANAKIMKKVLEFCIRNSD
ncbi:MAG TPA: DUF2817 domain-containing protein [Candidatus Paceibacterota bacterium]|nr:DUF2817 domain-containing protein [Candidatus Paceibacterota bacterium]